MMKTSIQLSTLVLLAAGVCGAAQAKLPAPSDEAKAAAAVAADKAGWANKVANFQLCQSQDRVATRTLAQARAAGKTVTPVAMPPCADPGPYVAADPAKKS
jgi:hypothetical protein